MRSEDNSIVSCLRSMHPPLTEKHAWPLVMSWIHWLMGIATLISIVTVYMAKYVVDQVDKPWWMYQHKAYGLVALLFLPPRIYYLIRTQKRRQVPLFDGPVAAKVAAAIVHRSMYICLIGLAVTAVIIGLWGGKGFPAFIGTIHSPFEVDTPFAKQSSRIHRYFFGRIFEWLVVLHIGAALAHAAYDFAIGGEGVMWRIDPFRIYQRWGAARRRKRSVSESSVLLGGTQVGRELA